MSLFVRIPVSTPSSVATRSAWVDPEPKFFRMSVIRTSAETVLNLRSITRSIVEAVRTTQALVAESYGLMMRLTPLAFASATVSASTSRLLVMMSPRIPSSMARRWMSRRSPTMISDWRAGIFSRSEMVQNVRMSMVPSRT